MAPRWLLLFCLLAAAAAEAKSVPPVNVVLVHGIFDTGRIFDPLVRVLEKQGCRCYAPSLQPNNCRDGVRAMALNLQREIDGRFGRQEPFVLVGFSLGGVAVRDYVQNLAEPGRVRAVFFISTPQHGTWWATLARGAGVKQLGLHSPFIQALNAHQSAWQHIPVSSFWTPFDLMIVPASSSRWNIGDTRQISCLLHPWMPRQRTVMAEIAAKVSTLRSGWGAGPLRQRR